MAAVLRRIFQIELPRVLKNCKTRFGEKESKLLRLIMAQVSEIVMKFANVRVQMTFFFFF